MRLHPASKVNQPAPRPSCPGDELLFAFAMGELDGEGRERAEAHLVECADCRAVLAETAQELQSGEADSADAQPVNRIGRYALVELLGAGAAGVVYRAFDPELQRVVALKLLRSGVPNASALPGASSEERTLREARLLAQLSHPNVVTVFDVGLDQGAVYIVMEYIAGTTLERWVHAQPRRSAHAIVSAYIQAGRGLSAAHDKRLVHRDFKPENVLVGRDGRIQVVDFGLARSLEHDENSVLTRLPSAQISARTRGLAGTPAYMAPELFEGRVADARSDQFSFCVALLGALLGRHPFGAEPGLREVDLLGRIQRRAITFSPAELPAVLREPLLRGISPEPAERHPDMHALISALEQALVRMRTPRRWLIAGTGLAFVIASAALALRMSSAEPASPGLSSGIARSALSRAPRFEAPRAPSEPEAPPAATPRAVPTPAASAEPLGVKPRKSTAPRAQRRPAKARVSASPRSQPATQSTPRGRKRYNDGLRDPF